MVNLKPKAYAGFAALTRGRPALGRALDFFPDYGPPSGMTVLHDELVTSPMAQPRYAENLVTLSQDNRESVQTSKGAPPYPMLRRIIWEAPDIYIPGRIIAPVDRGLGRIASFELEGPTNWSTTRPRPFRKPPAHIAGRAILIRHMKHYGHLLTDLLGPIAFAISRGHISQANPVTVVHAHADNPVTTAFIEGLVRMGLVRSVVTLGREDSCQADSFLQAEVLASSGEHRYALSEITPLLREIFAQAYSDRPQPAFKGGRVYVTRGDAKLRKVAGEAELIELLRQRGFHIFESRWDNHPEQLAVFSNHDLLLGVHGGGLANIIFSKPESRLVEIFAGDARKTTGLFWAACAGADYSCVFGGPEGPRQSFTIDAGAVVREVDQWLV